ncbi:hypothetical protein [Vibrio furnissii]|uniref:hypothetical protein n=1 Tax=Vibrio furnissii TaxID=29494 RepID=UPI001E5B6BA7|nr:hypothetical protein [Vibrio furnissii]MCG6266995.1 hypothetical protein [Vibrio furnissii]UHJ62138.1 hypothetical protein LUM42_21175 [Vibrio furnissii]
MKNTLLFHQIIDAFKILVPSGQSRYVLLMWAISNHAVRRLTRGREERAEFMALLGKFVNELNELYPIEFDESLSCDKEHGICNSSANRFD